MWGGHSRSPDGSEKGLCGAGTLAHPVKVTMDLREQLERVLRGRVRLMGLGNTDYGDDGFGVRLAEELIASGAPDVVIAGATAENHIGRVADEGFDCLVFLDAVDFGAAPGSVVLLNSKQIFIRYPQISTHKISLGVLAKWIRASGKTRVFLLGAQPESVNIGQDLTPTLQATLELLRDILLEIMTGNKVRTHADPREHGMSIGEPEDETVTAC